MKFLRAGQRYARAICPFAYHDCVLALSVQRRGALKPARRDHQCVHDCALRRFVFQGAAAMILANSSAIPERPTPLMPADASFCGLSLA